MALPEEMHAAVDEAAKTRAQLAGSSSSMVVSGVSEGVGADMAAKLAAAEARMKAMMEEMEAQRRQLAQALTGCCCSCRGTALRQARMRVYQCSLNQTIHELFDAELPCEIESPCDVVFAC